MRKLTKIVAGAVMAAAATAAMVVRRLPRLLRRPRPMYARRARSVVQLSITGSPC